MICNAYGLHPAIATRHEGQIAVLMRNAVLGKPPKPQQQRAYTFHLSPEYVAIERSILDLLSVRPMLAKEIEGYVDLHPKNLQRFLGNMRDRGLVVGKQARVGKANMWSVK